MRPIENELRLNGRQMLEVRKAFGFTQARMAMASGMSVATISRIENHPTALAPRWFTKWAMVELKAKGVRLAWMKPRGEFINNTDDRELYTYNAHIPCWEHGPHHPRKVMADDELRSIGALSPQDAVFATILQHPEYLRRIGQK